jgi:hypothetical protein
VTTPDVRLRAVVTLATSLVMVAAPGLVCAEEAASEPSVPRPSESLLSRVQAGGLVLFGVSYGIAFGVPAVAGFSEGREWFALPVAGPGYF